ncbi:MAG: hypothetical protein NTV66_10455 [Methylococcales bacterium]|nr:hypothetical protein [Methylococcales bacterium]
MLNTNTLKRFLTGLILLALSQVIYTNAYSQPYYVPIAQVAGIKILGTAGCLTCHTTDSSQNANRTNVKTDACTAAFSSNHDYNALKTCLTPVTPVAKVCALPLVSNGTTCVAAPKLGTGVNTVGNTTGKAAFDSYTINCGTGTSYLSAAVQDMPKVYTPRVGIQITRVGSKPTKQQYDPIDGDKLYSPVAKLVKGPGIYNVLVNKTIATGPATNKTAEKYNAVYACQNANGVKTLNTKPAVVINN